jgi:hypothetical protein
MYTSFQITELVWPYNDLLNENQRKAKIRNIKIEFKTQLHAFRKTVETGDLNQEDRLLKIDQCKANLLKINGLIASYNEFNPHKKPIKLLPDVDFKYWKSEATGLLVPDICSHIASCLPYEDLMSWRKTCKNAWQAIENYPFLRLRLKMAHLNHSLLTKQKSVQFVDGFKTRLRKYKYKPFNALINELSQLQKQQILNQHEVLQSRQDLIQTAEKCQGQLVYLLVFLRLQVCLETGTEETELSTILKFAKDNSIKLLENEIEQLTSNSS